MTEKDSSHDRRTESLAEEYLALRRRGADPGLEDFLARHPAQAEDLRELLPLLVRLSEISGSASERADGQPGHPTRIGAYRILRELGRGGMGVVYEALHEELGRRVALKVLPPERLGTEQAWRRFRREAEIAARLEHEGICGVYEAGSAEGLPYIAMRYVQGRDLAQILEEARAQDPAQRSSAARELYPSGLPRERTQLVRIARLGAKVARALHAAHTAGVLHRDVKPANVMITAAGEPLLLDFGLAREAEGEGTTLTASRDVLGTPAYMPPEQISGKRSETTAQSDVWSLGALLYECSTLRRPFEAPNRQALYRAILERDPPDPRSLNAGIPPDLTSILRVALEKSPARRYATAQTIALDLEAWCEGRAVSVRPLAAPAKLARWVRRRPGLAVSGGICVLSLTLAPLFVHWRERHAEAALSAERERGQAYLRGACETVEHLIESLGSERLTLALREHDHDSELFETALASYGRFLVESGNDPRVRLEAAKARRMVAFLQERMGHLPEAERYLRDALASLTGLQAEGLDEQSVRLALAGAGLELGRLLRTMGRLDEAGRILEQALTSLRESGAASPAKQGLLLAASIEDLLATIAMQAGRYAESLATYRQAFDAVRDLRAAPDWSPADDYDYVQRAEALAACLIQGGDYERAEQLLREILPIAGQMAQELADPKHTYLLASCQRRLALLAGDSDREAEAETLFRSAVARLHELRTRYPALLAYSELLALCLDELGSMLRSAGREQDSLDPYAEALRLRRALREAAPESLTSGLLLAQSLANHGWSLRSTDYASACAQMEEGLRLDEELLRARPDELQLHVDLANGRNLLAIVRDSHDEVAAAEQLFRSALDERRRLLELQPGRPLALAELGQSLANVGRFLRERRQDPAAALALQLEGIDLSAAAREANPHDSRFRLMLRDQYYGLCATAEQLADHALLADCALRWADAFAGDGEVLFLALAYLARTIPLAEDDASLDEDQRALACEHVALEAASRAEVGLRAGWLDRERLRDASLEALRSQPAFEALLGR